MSGIVSTIGFVMMGGGLAGLVIAHQVVSAAPLVIALQVGAVVVMVWARLTLGRRSFHATASPTEGRLVTTGPYRWVRHPIYAAVCLFSWACCVGHLSRLALGLAAIVTVGGLVRVFAEEKLLRARYPEYLDYARRTKRLVPYVF
jgi:protein-S-isoprenylcysteine O-methyltransferase Ste14